MARRNRKGRDQFAGLRQAQREQAIMRELKRITPQNISVSPITTAGTIGQGLQNLLIRQRQLLPGYALKAAQLAADTIRPELELPGKKLLFADPKLYNAAGNSLQGLQTDTIQKITRELVSNENLKTVGELLESAGYKTVNTIDNMEIQSYNLEATAAFTEAEEQWQWVAQCDGTTCSYCWAMHGTIHDSSEPMTAHPHCRCEARRVDNRRQTTDSKFQRLSSKQQNQILGPTAAAAYRDGKFDLADTFKYSNHPKWGRVVKRKNLSELLGNN